MNKIICWFNGHLWGQTFLDQAIFNAWGIRTCKRCWHKTGEPYINDDVTLLRLMKKPELQTLKGEDKE